MLLAAFMAAAAGGPAAAQVPAGPEFQVNTYTTDAQATPAVGMDARGRFVIAWGSLGRSWRGAAS